ncbi:MAG: hypothetical protein ACRD2W_14070, partial [Acidimicrobiales bacterium]
AGAAAVAAVAVARPPAPAEDVAAAETAGEIAPPSSPGEDIAAPEVAESANGVTETTPATALEPTGEPTGEAASGDEAPVEPGSETPDAPAEPSDAAAKRGPGDDGSGDDGDDAVLVEELG